jgi:transcriptional regulator with XRE-family HTH domain
MTDRAHLRKRAAISLRELEAKTGISRSRLSLYELGQTNLDEDELVRVAAVLNHSLCKCPTFDSPDQVVDFLSASAR